VFDNWVLRKVLGLLRAEGTGGKEKLHNDFLHDFYSSTYIIRMFKIRKVKCGEEHVAHIGEF
jgi:hypothetical protein